MKNRSADTMKVTPSKKAAVKVNSKLSKTTAILKGKAVNRSMPAKSNVRVSKKLDAMIVQKVSSRPAVKSLKTARVSPGAKRPANGKSTRMAVQTMGKMRMGTKVGK